MFLLSLFRRLRVRCLREGLLPALVLLPCVAHADGVRSVHRNERGQIVVEAGSPVDHRLKVEKVISSPWTRGVTVPGQIETITSRSGILAPAAGRVLDVPVSPGDPVKKGQLLVRLLSGDAAQAISDERKAHSAAVLADQALLRIQGVLRAGGGAQKDLDAARDTARQAEVEELRAKARVVSLSADPVSGGEIRLLSPMDGVIGAVNVASGMNVTDPSQPLVTMQDLQTVRAVADVPEDYIRGVEMGQAVKIRLPAWPGVVRSGAIDGIEPELMPDTRALRVHVKLDNSDGRLRPGMFTTMTIQEPRPAVVEVPQSALLMNNDLMTVFVEVEPLVFERRPVKVVYDDDVLVRVAEGLTAGERVVTRGAVLLNDD
ncbi:efflux RND transporter periplasmic adaptor subunit [Acetobacter sp. AN02]|uniref:efflux RND transporter periplasmic adaptor subunit n=1 Tax=Acetobacter sp. AN02 TaxID=2894186 RepID=UPI002434453A|nr:efflux RND transporter periplasmic adaptor subunit [Acetobacter sp. AN02]MDG6094201.1 efflux RND transporter periplasmic adaptor subunit [Acetobacter sp. AN02]